ncbi:serine/threonine-protein kinase [Nonomuraea sp. NPDC005983]|uniref:WD40 repeat domain-containing serine/threonine protein kinase n=1 Tax=Nonomuraea sp. NPDC005983 TaxID=3155595 RepID=UPI0033A8AB6C
MEALRPGDPRRVGTYRLEGRLGEGGMGQVFLGSTPGGRPVAVKLIRAEHADNPGFRVRFAREVEAARKVGGFYTAQVVDADPASPEPWMVTAFIPGPSLRDVVIRQGPLGPDRVRFLGKGLVEGLAAIHACGLVHRDLKPGNVIMSPDGPRIIDFGIARAADASTLTATGTVVGTYAYMAPEQINADETGPAADVFALGCVLTFAATGRGPFDATNIPAIIHRIIAKPPDLAGLEGDLRDIVAACLAKSPRERLPLAEAAARLAAPPRRIPRRAVITGVAAATVAAVTVPATLLWSSGAGPRRTAPATSLGVPVPTLLIGGPVSMFHLAFTADDRTLVGAGHRSIWRWDVATGLGSTTEVADAMPTAASMALSANGRVIANAVRDTDSIEIRDVATGRVTSRVKPARAAHSMALTDDGRRLATSHDETVQICDVRTGRALHTLTAGPSSVETLVFSPDGRLLAAGSHYTSEIRLWDTASGRAAGMLTADRPGGMAFSPDGSILASTLGGELDVGLWDVTTQREIRTLNGHKDEVLCLAFNPDGRTLASGGRDKTVRLWNARTGAVIATLTGNTSVVSAVGFGSDGRTLASATNSGATRLWRYP